jgi:hypothetical protein
MPLRWPFVLHPKLIEIFLRRKLQNGFITVLVRHLTSDQNLEETRTIKCLFPTAKGRSTSGQSNLIGTEQKRGYMKKPEYEDERDFCFINCHTAKSMKKGDWVDCQNCNIWYHKMRVVATGKRQFTFGRCD